MATLESLNSELSQQTEQFNNLRKENAPAEALEATRKRLAELKAAIRSLKATDSGANEGEKKERLLLKTAKGTRDYGPSEMFCREHIINIVKECFAVYGGAELDTPVFERKDVLTDKYGEDSKLIFDLKDQGGEQLALRYDHTVPLARYLAMSGGTNTQSKFWQVGKVYRRDNPVMSKGRMREFLQADFDMTGQWDSMIPDAEVISLVCSILTNLRIGEFTIKLNNRKILDGIFEVCGVPPEKTRPISSAVDKLDKLPWEKVKAEMTEEKGLDPVCADKIGEYVKLKGKRDLLDTLLADKALTENKRAKEGLDEMSLLFTYLEQWDVLDKISFDMSLARGLDYYTGIIYEAITEASAPPGFNSANANAPAPVPAPVPAPKKKGKKPPADAEEEEEVDESQVGVGSIAAGGRYDGLVGSFAAAASGDAKKKSQGTPCVGVSIGLDRVFALVWPQWVEKGMRSRDVMAYVMSAGDGLLGERIKLVQELRKEKIRVDYLAKKKPKGMSAQFAAGEQSEVPFAIIVGVDELKAGLVTVKQQRWEFKDGKKVKVESEEKGTQVKRSELVQWLKSTPVYQQWESAKLIDV